MTDHSARLSLPLLQPGQAQKEMTHNEALTILDMLVQGSAAGIAANPPVDPEPGQCWIVGTAPLGSWSGHSGTIAGWSGGGWRFVTPREGMRLWIDAAHGFAQFRGGEWRLGEAYGKVFVEGQQVVGTKADPIAEPVGGVTVDAEARAAIVAVLEALRTHGLVGSE